MASSVDMRSRPRKRAINLSRTSVSMPIGNPGIKYTHPPVLVPPIISKYSQGFGTSVSRCSCLIRFIMWSMIKSSDSPRIPPPSILGSQISTDVANTIDLPRESSRTPRPRPGSMTIDSERMFVRVVCVLLLYADARGTNQATTFPPPCRLVTQLSAIEVQIYQATESSGKLIESWESTASMVSE
jgi:hypothetical protein